MSDVRFDAEIETASRPVCWTVYDRRNGLVAASGQSRTPWAAKLRVRLAVAFIHLVLRSLGRGGSR